ncbi:AfsR/SARP family transcriptional regulator [Streptomyces sp. ME19-01-6]|uniref:AfsR/SARP family transcriptional regulator n=1 Tax=Streptomyces sp. ME19-01-6 TaxID=3028686 RepID=UPI0029AC7283|nr:BTAD domain-containing putative transcriptional regulator [Streptomyces sp. ME19-01-6]MDX3230929.1 BTAD domain-containing putative transcriptional regulator [Streptomyces sp. ME19-01-6]
MGAITLQFGLLGPVRAAHDGTDITLGPPQRRAVLAILLLSPGQAVTIATLRERIWAGPPPASATQAVHVHICHLRRLLSQFTDGAPLLTTHPGHAPDQVSYVLHSAPEAVDAAVFRRLLEDGESAQSSGDTRTALTHYDTALDLWRGEPVADLQPSAYVRSVRLSLAEIRLDLGKRHAAALLHLGAAARATAELQDLHAHHPGDESIVVLLARALHATGAHTRALRLLTDELERWEREYGLLPPALLDQRDSLVHSAGRAGAVP